MFLVNIYSFQFNLFSQSFFSLVNENLNDFQKYLIIQMFFNSMQKQPKLICIIKIAKTKKKISFRSKHARQKLSLRDPSFYNFSIPSQSSVTVIPFQEYFNEFFLSSHQKIAPWKMVEIIARKHETKTAQPKPYWIAS